MSGFKLAARTKEENRRGREELSERIGKGSEKTKSFDKNKEKETMEETSAS